MKRILVLALSFALVVPAGAVAQSDYETDEREVEWSETPVEFLIPGPDAIMGLANADFCLWMAYALDVDITDEAIERCVEEIASLEAALLPETMLPAIMESVLPAASPIPSPRPTPKATPKPTKKPKPKATPKPTKKPKPKATHRQLSKRGWQRVVKAPDSHIGKEYILWSCITQFDAATGEDTFRGDASYKNWKGDFWYQGDNAIFTGPKRRLSRFVQDDIVWMKVTSFGSLSYDTQIGGSTTVPMFWVDQIKRVGSC